MDKPVHSRVQRIWLFLKIKNTDPLMGAKFKSNKHLLYKIFWFFAPFLARLASKFEKKYQNDQQQKIILKRSYQRTQNFMLISNPLKKFLKMHQNRL